MTPVKLELNNTLQFDEDFLIEIFFRFTPEKCFKP